MKAAVLALKAGAEREALKADVPRRSAEAIVVADCRREKKWVLEGKIAEKRKAPGRNGGGSPSPRSPDNRPQQIAAEGWDFGSTVLVDLKRNHYVKHKTNRKS